MRVTVHPPCSGSGTLLPEAETEPVVMTGLGNVSHTGVCPDCGQCILVMHGQLIEHRLPERVVEVASIVDEPLDVDHRTLRERLRGRAA